MANRAACVSQPCLPLPDVLPSSLVHHLIFYSSVCFLFAHVCTSFPSTWFPSSCDTLCELCLLYMEQTAGFLTAASVYVVTNILGPALDHHHSPPFSLVSCLLIYWNVYLTPQGCTADLAKAHCCLCFLPKSCAGLRIRTLASQCFQTRISWAHAAPCWHLHLAALTESPPWPSGRP